MSELGKIEFSKNEDFLLNNLLQQAELLDRLATVIGQVQFQAKVVGDRLAELEKMMVCQCGAEKPEIPLDK